MVDIVVRVRLPWRARLLVRVARVLLRSGTWLLERAVTMVEVRPLGPPRHAAVPPGAPVTTPPQPQSPASQVQS